MYAKYGLDKPVMERYVITMKGLVHGDFGESIIYEMCIRDRTIAQQVERQHRNAEHCRREEQLRHE